MGCKFRKVNPVTESAIRHVDNNDDNETNKNSIIAQPDIAVHDATIAKLVGSQDHIEIKLADPQAFDDAFVQQRQQAIDNGSYRSTIELWRPNSLQQLVETMETFSNEKSLIDRHWIIFYWIACNIEYDTVSYYAEDCQDSSAEAVFRTKKGVCAGYTNLYKYLCDQLQMTCEKVSGYSKAYAFEDHINAPTSTDHTWNVVEIDGHSYLIESTLGAGYLNEQKAFKHKLNSYYFLARPNEIIYHHLPENEKWQLLRTPITMTQYLQLPQVHPTYFELSLQLVTPRDQGHVDLLPDKSYALVLIRAPSDVHLMVDLKLNNQKIDGGHQVILDKQKQLYCCYFAPGDIGKHKITIYGKRGDTKSGKYKEALNLTLDAKEMPTHPVSFPKIWENFFHLGLEVLSPENTHLIKMNSGATHTEVQITTPENVELLGCLENESEEEVKGGHQVYHDRETNIWRCKFAPDRNGVFEALILAKEKSNLGSYTSAVSFKIEAIQIPSPPLSYPQTWQIFYDLNLKVEAPKYRSTAVWAENASYAEVLIQAPDDVQLSCHIQYNNVKVENGSLAQFDNNKRLWQLLFAPEQTGPHELFVFAKRNNNSESPSSVAVKFDLDVTKLQQPMKFPRIHTQFQTKKCQIYTPMNGILKRDSVVPIHCVIPDAIDVNLIVDSNGLETEGYTDSTLQRSITVGSKAVSICAKYGESTNYYNLAEYTVE